MPSYVIYCRKSSESEERQVLSIESQLKELNDLTKRLHLPVSAVLTESRSAKYPGRPVFGNLLEKISRGEIKGIISWKLDRLARNPLDGAAIVWALDQGKIEEIITPYNHLHNNSNDKFLMQLEFGMAKKYVDDLSDNVKRGNRMKLEKGWMPGRAPLGYLNEPRERTIVPDPERFPIVRKMWDFLLQGQSPLHIHQRASEELGLRNRTRTERSGNPVSVSTIYKLFINPFYYGAIRRKGTIYQGKHQPMITEEEFWQAQALLGRKGIPRPKTRFFAYTGFIKCGECGCSITAEEKVNHYGSHYTYYHCTKKIREVKCSQKVVQAEELERQMIDHLDRIHISSELLDFAISTIEKESQNDREQVELSKLALTKAFRECERKLDTLRQMRLSDLINDEEFLRDKQKLTDEKMKIEKSLERSAHGYEDSDKMTKKVFTFAHDAKERFVKGTPEVKKSIIREIGSNFFLKEKKLSIEVKKPFRLIQDTLITLNSRNEGFELPNSVMNSNRKPLRSSNFLVWCG